MHMVWHDHVFIECRARKTNGERQHFFANQGFDRTSKVHCTSRGANGDEIEPGRRIIEIPKALPLSRRVAFHENAPTQTWFRSRADPDRAGRPRSAPTFQIIEGKRAEAERAHPRWRLDMARIASPRIAPFGKNAIAGRADKGVAGRSRSAPTTRIPNGGPNDAGRPRSAPTPSHNRQR